MDGGRYLKLDDFKDQDEDFLSPKKTLRDFEGGVGTTYVCARDAAEGRLRVQLPFCPTGPTPLPFPEFRACLRRRSCWTRWVRIPNLFGVVCAAPWWCARRTTQTGFTWLWRLLLEVPGTAACNILVWANGALCSPAGA